MSSTATAAVVDKVEPLDAKTQNHFNLNVSFVAPSYGQVMQGRLLVFRPAIVSRRDALPLSDSRRKQPVVLTSSAYQETVRVKLPAGFDVDEMPDAVKLDMPFGSYATTYEVKDGNLVFTRKLVQRASTIPPEQYNSVRSFFEKIRNDACNPAINRPAVTPLPLTSAITK